MSDIHNDENVKELMLNSRRRPHTYQVIDDDASSLPDKSIGESFSAVTPTDSHQVPRSSPGNNTSATKSNTDMEGDKRTNSEIVHSSSELPVVTSKIDKVPLVAFQDSHELWSPSLLLDIDSPPTSPELNRHHSSRISTPRKSSEIHNRPVDSLIHTAATDPINTPNYTNPIIKTVQQTVIDKKNLSATNNSENTNQENFGNVKYSTPKQISHDSREDKLPSNDSTESVKQTSDDQVVIRRKISEGKPRKKITSPVPFRKVSIFKYFKMKFVN